MLVIVESPNKVKSIQSYLGSGYEVVATKGHFRDLPRKHPGNLPEKWEAIRGKGGIVTALRKASKRNPDGVILATDPDREGEGIAWHVCDVLGLDPASTPRAVFHEITRDAVREGVRKAIHPDGPRLNQPLVGAQKARRLIDRRIGYSGTRYLWKTIGGGVSAGRCLIPAAVLLREINRREDAAGKRVVIKGEIQTPIGTFRLRQVVGDTDDDIPTTTESLQRYIPNEIPIESMKTSPIRRDPPKPLDTAAAMGAIGLSPSAAMRALQSLFEKGLITYHRTTSRVVSDTFRALVGVSPRSDASSLIAKDGAHEAIRPAGSIIQPPDTLLDTLDETERRVYGIIWKHAVGSFYPAWKGETLRMKLDGDWMQTWERTTSKDMNWMSATGCEPAHMFPPDVMSLTEGDSVMVTSGCVKVVEESAGRGVTEAGMVRVLKEAGIGRPSTYSTIISNLSARGLAGFLPKKRSVLAELYVGDSHGEESVQTYTPPSSFRVTETGESCIRSLNESAFAEFFQVEYTSKMEAILDSIAEGIYTGGWEGFVLETDTSVSDAEKTCTITKTTEDKKGAFPETILGVVDGWTYGKGRTRYGPVVWRQKDVSNAKREYKKISSKRWHQVTVNESVKMLCK